MKHWICLCHAKGEQAVLCKFREINLALPKFSILLETMLQRVLNRAYQYTGSINKEDQVRSRHLKMNCAAGITLSKDFTASAFYHMKFSI